MSAPQPLILVCDHRGDGLALRLRDLASLGWRTEVCENARSTFERIAHERPDAIVLDPLAEGGRAELEELERRQGNGPPVPLLLVAEPGAALQPAAATRALERQVFDLIHRGSSVEEFRLRIARLLLESAQREEIDDLRHRALFDDRTELLRPRAFQQRLGEHYSAAERHRFEMALLLVDLDDFGRVNKTYDHTVGDLVIAKVGAAIRASLRAEDVAGRLGGDEFALVLPYTGRLDAARVVRRLLEEIRGLSGRIPGAPPEIHITASVGFETFSGTDLPSLEEMRSHAEAALRQAKRKGGDRGVYYRSLAAHGAS